MLAIKLPEEIEKRLSILAKRTGRTETFYAKEAILKYMEDLEDTYLAETAYKKFEDSGEKRIPLEDIMREYGLEN
ncbi:MAG: TraY domain-containing protein [Desulfobacteraceae bacterium]|nr:TraY domain-containing protein [Desulfobacteraceae bacterium]